ncbi:C39 family peptidase [Microcoleus sp. FACHB-1515]|uniref:C39 family peptidase n=1 Tax=Cyanophyceae TaxID=3028117 RepID=UPI001683F219|nr:C39 family peptidase [Microcoleus sp. FACHB-1515]MBD2092474.1 C39 family peptidase [Microcoleus sp. FACHB-1515]
MTQQLLRTRQLLQAIASTPIEISQLPEQAAIELQTLLKQAGYNVGSIDGIVGDRTLAEFAEFKEAVWLSSGEDDPNRYVLGQSSFNKLIDMASTRIAPTTDEGIGAILLPVEFEEQTDNRVQPHRTCNTTSCFMVARFLGAEIDSDDAFWKIVNRFGDTTNHAVQTKALEAVGIRSRFRQDMGFSDIDESLLKGLPVVISIFHRGTLAEPRGGHVIVCIGRDADGENYIFHDPYGSLLNGYRGPATNGRSVRYSRKILTRRWLYARNNDRAAGWGRTFYGNSRE